MECVSRRSKAVADWRDDDRRSWEIVRDTEEANIFLRKTTERLKRGTFRRPAETPKW